MALIAGVLPLLWALYAGGLAPPFARAVLAVLPLSCFWGAGGQQLDHTGRQRVKPTRVGSLHRRLPVCTLTSGASLLCCCARRVPAVCCFVHRLVVHCVTVDAAYLLPAVAPCLTNLLGGVVHVVSVPGTLSRSVAVSGVAV